MYQQKYINKYLSIVLKSSNWIMQELVLKVLEVQHVWNLFQTRQWRTGNLVLVPNSDREPIAICTRHGPLGPTFVISNGKRGFAFFHLYCSLLCNFKFSGTRACIYHMSVCCLEQLDPGLDLPCRHSHLMNNSSVAIFLIIILMWCVPFREFILFLHFSFLSWLILNPLEFPSHEQNIQSHK